MTTTTPSVFTINPDSGPEDIDRAHVDFIQPGRMWRLVGDEQWLMDSGHYDGRLMARNKTGDVDHVYNNPADLLRALLHTRQFEGDEQTDIPESDQRRMDALFARVGYLRLWATDGIRSGPELQAFNTTCGEVAGQMGRPVNEVKNDIFGLLLDMMDMTPEDRMNTLGEILNLSQERLDQICAITTKVNGKAGLVVLEIVHQQELMQSVGRELRALYTLHVERGMPQPDADFKGRVDHLMAQLDGVKDRPWCHVAAHDRDDIMAFKRTNDGRCLQRAAVAHEHLYVPRGLNIALHRLAMGQARNGSTRNGIMDRALTGLMKLRSGINPETGKIMRHNPLPGALGRMNEALRLWRGRKPDWDKIKKLLKDARDGF